MTHNKFDTLLRSVAIFGLFFVAACGDSETAKTDTAAGQATTVAEAPENTDSKTSAHQNGTWGDIVYGAEGAPVTVIEYASLTCPHCASFKAEVFPKIKETYIDTGKVKFIYRNFLLNRVDMAASAVARCGDEATTKKLMDVFFGRQAEWMRADNPTDGLAAVARRTVNMSRAEFDRCLSNKEMHQHLVKMTTDGQTEFQISGTPTVIVAGKATENYSWEVVSEAIEGAL